VEWLGDGQRSAVGIRDGNDHLYGSVVIKTLGDLLMKPATHTQRGSVDLFVVRYETNSAILHDIFRSIRIVLCKSSPERCCITRRALVNISP
jgi:hypothetical protein